MGVSAVIVGAASERHLEPTLAALRGTLEEMALAKPPLLPSVGYMIPRAWRPAIKVVHALRDAHESRELADHPRS